MEEMKIVENEKKTKKCSKPKSNCRKTEFSWEVEIKIKSPSGVLNRE